MRTLFLDYFAQSLVLGLAVLALLAAAPFLQKRYSARWFCRAWLALAVLLALPLRAVLPEAAPATVTLTPPPALLAVEEHGEDIVRVIDSNIRNFKADRLFPVDRAVLTIAVAEILYFDDIPPVVSVSEAVDLAQKYSTETSADFVNGVLSGVIANV